ncbi:RNase II stability modulator [Yersinia frederiksenii]|uniref:RNase II stability modulator n=2 Tax=Yersinia frederiksenii TaxID=29484 RepID=A0A380PYB3_YERFR|nr:EAL domain-containing protein [Yersinia frederiksenii]ATM97036.1 EAL domain-containing protein [Yersinia frederiksenii]EEQ16892.1 Response regulator/EAL domain protein [Yersinia frederiksenii ATCC 33641]KGA45533.1 EAL domain protein [Yersinia frederiksenii ATCC 33641]SUP78584.1 RNase II stability modulator [Yersinia frederiksenii]
MQLRYNQLKPQLRINAYSRHLIDRNMLERGLDEGTIKAWFQPRIALSSGKIVAVEALARWDHPEYGFMLAGSFFEAIGHYNLQRTLVFKILSDALDAHLRWQRVGHILPVSINIPVPLLDDMDFLDELYRRVNASGIDVANVSIELIEDEAISDPVNYYQGTRRLRQQGFGLARDDFGCGYSSMYNLTSMPFTDLKIDRSFVSGVLQNDAQKIALISSVQLGKQLGLKVTAEGVETVRELEFLRQIGCDFAQGFLISAAVSAESLEMLLYTE